MPMMLVNFDIKHLSYTDINGKSFEEFKSFLDSLDEERKTWSFDKQTFKDEKEWYDSVSKRNTHSMFLLYKHKIIGFSNGYTTTNDEGAFYEISFVVKKEYQGKGLGTQILLIVEQAIRNNPVVVEHKADTGEIIGTKNIVEMVAKHYSDNIASHKAFLKAGWYEAKLQVDDEIVDNSTLVWMMKKL